MKRYIFDSGFELVTNDVGLIVATGRGTGIYTEVKTDQCVIGSVPTRTTQRPSVPPKIEEYVVVKGDSLPSVLQAKIIEIDDNFELPAPI